MTYRLWYAQLDVFDTIRRYLALLKAWNGKGPSRDRLFTSDFYLANPCLLHLTHMTLEARRSFQALKVPRPEQSFLRYPSPSILYSKMAGIQAQALHNLIGKGLLDVELVDNDQYELSPSGAVLAGEMEKQPSPLGEAEVLEFLTTKFAAIGEGKGGLRGVTGLRRLGT
jgi:hypothetical protein